MTPWLSLAVSGWLLFGLLAGYAAWHRWTLRRRLAGAGVGFPPGMLPGTLPRVRATVLLASGRWLPPAAFLASWLFWSWMGLPAWMALLLAGLAWPLVGRLYVRWQVGRHQQRLESQLPGLAWQLAAALRAGRSLPQALEHATCRLPAPSSRLALDLVERLRLGQPLEMAVGELVPGQGGGLGLLRASLALHLRLGTNLPQSLSQTAATLSRAASMREEADAALAQARTSAVLVAFLPLATLVLVRISLPGQVMIVLGQPAGWLLLVVFLAAQALALALVHILGRIER